MLLFMLAGCSTTLARVPGPQASSAPPKVDSLMDLGALPLAEGALDTKYQDDRFTPSEWIAVMGEGLHDATISVDDVPLSTGGYLAGGSVLVRLPGSLAPGEHRLAAKSAAGEATTTFSSLIYVIGSDTDGDAIRFLRIGAGKRDEVDDPDLSIDQPRSLFHTLSPDGSILYSLGLDDKRKQPDGTILYVIDIAMVHMGGKDKPEALGSLDFAMSSHPTGITVAQESLLLVLGTNELVMFQIGDPKRLPEPIGKLPLSQKETDRYLDMALIQNGLALAVLEVNDNLVAVVSLADPKQPRKIAELELGPQKGLPFSVDLTSDPTDPNAFFVLQGLNMRLGAKKMEEGKNTVTGAVQAAYDLVLGKEKKQEQPPELPVDFPDEGRLIGLRLKDTGLEKTMELPLPSEFLPLFAVPASDGRFYVSGVAPGAIETSSLDPSVDSAAKLLGLVKDTVQLGKIAVINRDGTSSIEVQGVALFFDVDVLPNGELVYSGMRISGKVLPPFLTVKWGVGVGSAGFYGLHDLSYDYVIPPYTYGQVSVQRAR